MHSHKAASLIIAGLMALLPIDPIARAEDHPTLPQVYGMSDNDMLMFDCKQPERDKIECLIQEINIKSDPDGITKQESTKVMDDFLKGSTDECKDTDKLKEAAEAIQTGVPPKGTDATPFLQHLDSMAQQERDFSVSLLNAMYAYCKNQNPDTAKALLSLMTDHSLHTCLIKSQKDSKTFNRGENGAWVSTEGPYSECGVIELSTLEPAKDAQGQWLYNTRKIVTKKNGGKFYTGEACEKLDDKQHDYDWKPVEKFLGCDYVRFGF